MKETNIKKENIIYLNLMTEQGNCLESKCSEYDFNVMYI